MTRDDAVRAPLRVLLLEDSDDDAALLARRLQRDGYDATLRRIESRRQLLAALAERPRWDVVLCDSGIADLSPGQVATLLQRQHSDVPVVVVSGKQPADASLPHVSKTHLGRLRPTLQAVLAPASAAHTEAGQLAIADLERLFELSLDILCVAGFDGYFRRVNPAFERILGYSAAALLARPFLDLVHPDDRARTVAEMENLTAGVPTLSFENRYRCADGTYRWLAWTSMPVPSEQLLYAVARDVTEAKQLAESAAAATHELEAFSYSVSHDLRAPLRAIAGFSRAALEDCSEGLGPAGTTYLTRIEAAAERMERLIADLLALAHIGRHELQLGPVDLTALAREVGAQCREREPHRRVTLTVAEGLGATADAGLLRVVMENLLDNAWKYSRRRRRADIGVGRVATAVPDTFFVRDNGAGFNPRHAERLFVPFQRLHGPEQFEGTGIGLATVRRIVHRHGGRIWATGAVDRGATFYFTLAAARQ